MLIEYEENQHRKDFTWQEEAVACKRMYDAIRMDKPGYTAKAFAVLIYIAESKLSTLLKLLEYSDIYPTIWIMDKWTAADLELQRMIRGDIIAEKLRRASDNPSQCSVDTEEHREGRSYDKQSVNKNTQLTAIKHNIKSKYVIYPDAVDMLKALPDYSVDLCVTDPPFGIDIEASRATAARHHVYDTIDTKVAIMALILDVIKGLQVKMKPGAHVYMFFAMQYYETLVKALHKHEFTVNPLPLIWIKPGSGVTAQPSYLPGSSYEPILMAFAPGDRRMLEKRGLSNVIQSPSISPSKRDHPLEKSVDLYKDIISRSCYEGDMFIDPFCGVGNSLVAARRLGCDVRGAECVQGYRKIANLKMLEER
jgi:DNA modification methylase